MVRKVFYYFLLIALPLAGSGIDLARERLVSLNSITFSLGRWLLLYDALMAILLMAIIVWLVWQTKHIKIPEPIAVIISLVGLYILCIPALYIYGLGPRNFLHVFYDSILVHQTLAGAALLVMGIFSFTLRSQKTRSSREN
jgi:hypothetical protein